MLAVVWHFWLGLILAVGCIFSVLALVVGYIVKVQRPQYPRKS